MQGVHMSRYWLLARRVALFCGLMLPGLLMLTDPDRWHSIGSLGVLNKLVPLWLFAVICIVGAVLILFRKFRDVGDIIGACVYAALLMAWLTVVLQGKLTSPFGIAFGIACITYLWAAANASFQRDAGGR